MSLGTSTLGTRPPCLRQRAWTRVSIGVACQHRFESGTSNPNGQLSEDQADLICGGGEDFVGLQCPLAVGSFALHGTQWPLPEKRRHPYAAEPAEKNRRCHTLHSINYIQIVYGTQYI